MWSSGRAVRTFLRHRGCDGGLSACELVDGGRFEDDELVVAIVVVEL